jgi:putative DNA primase/helicase
MLAMAQPDVAIMPEQLDADPMLLNVQNGTVDLRTGQLRPHRQTDYCTKICSAPYQPGADSPTLRRFNNRIFRTYPGLIEFVQTAIGYAATGMTREQVLMFLYGKGSNGKTTLMDAVMYVLGDYAAKADPELLMARDGSAAHPCGVADLMGRRLVVCSETNEGKRFDESKLKDLVGETRLKARLMRENFYEFTATHKIFNYSNHKPVVRGTDYGFWRRIRVIPFIETIGEDEKDRTLPEKLKAEATGILAWIVTGAVRWHQKGLTLPPEVSDATKEYRKEMDSIGAFFSERCEDGEHKVYALELYSAYKSWAEATGEHPLSQKRLGTTLTERGYQSDRCSYSGRTIWTGIRLKKYGTSQSPAN